MVPGIQISLFLTPLVKRTKSQEMGKIWAAEKGCARSVKDLPKMPATARCPPINHILSHINLCRVQFISPPFTKLGPSHVSRAKASDKILILRNRLVWVLLGYKTSHKDLTENELWNAIRFLFWEKRFDFTWTVKHESEGTVRSHF